MVIPKCQINCLNNNKNLNLSIVIKHFYNISTFFCFSFETNL